MKKKLSIIVALFFSLVIISCGGKESASSVGKKWCELNGKVAKAAEGAEKEAAKAAIDKWENEIEAKYKGDEAFMKEVEKEAEKCEAASEGR